MKIAIANDHSALELKKEIIALLTEMGHTYQDFGTYKAVSCDYPIYAARAAHAVVNGECDYGILICGTGIGIGIAANKIPGVRCALCHDPLSAELTRQHNNANMLSMGARIIGPELAKAIVRTFLTTETQATEGRHARRVEMLSALERGEALE